MNPDERALAAIEHDEWAGVTQRNRVACARAIREAETEAYARGFTEGKRHVCFGPGYSDEQAAHRRGILEEREAIAWWLLHPTGEAGRDERLDLDERLGPQLEELARRVLGRPPP